MNRAHRWLRLPVLVVVVGVGAGITALTGVVRAAPEPRFTVSTKVGAFEVRDYPALLVADVTIGGDRNRAANQGFRVLASYIFGANAGGQSIPMTAPVVQARPGADVVAVDSPVRVRAAGGAWLIRFILPGDYSLQSLPKPRDPRIQLATLPPTRFAVVRFSGLARDPDVARSTADLKAFVESHHLKASGPAELARYNPPWIPWFMRRNEIWVPLAPASPP